MLIAIRDAIASAITFIAVFFIAFFLLGNEYGLPFSTVPELLRHRCFLNQFNLGAVHTLRHFSWMLPAVPSVFLSHGCSRM